MGKLGDQFYVSNKLLFQEYLDWYANIKVAEEEGIEEPQIPPYIVEAMMKISSRLAYKANFINYSFRDELISDALYDCIRFAKKFNPEKGSNPFSYITTICFRAFLRRIDKEKTQSYIKASIVCDTVDHEFFEGHCDEDDAEFSNQYLNFLREVGFSDSHTPMSIKRAKIKKELQLNTPTIGPLDDFEED